MSRRQALRDNLAAMNRRLDPPPPRDPSVPRRRAASAAVQPVAPPSGMDGTTAPPEPCQRPPEALHVMPVQPARSLADMIAAEDRMFDALARQVAAEDAALARAVGLDHHEPDHTAAPDGAEDEWI